MNSFLFSLPLFLLVGLTAGFIAGVLGLGGGVVVVPLLSLAFAALDIEPGYIHRLSVGTSMAAIIATSLTSALTHNKTIPLDKKRILACAPGLTVGTLAGSFAAAHISTIALKVIFVAFLVFLATRISGKSTVSAAAKTPGLPLLLAAGLAIGFLCSLVGVAGGAVIVPFLMWTGLTLHQAVGSSAALGFFISLAGAGGYLLSGLNDPGLPAGAVGFIHLPALAFIIMGTVLTAPRGARLAHRLSPDRLRRVFSLTMLAMAAIMLWGLLRPLLSFS